MMRKNELHQLQASGRDTLKTVTWITGWEAMDFLSLRTPESIFKVEIAIPDSLKSFKETS